ncbi:MAG: Cof-type HAD-IIB family hydrolase [Clostridia bacterium]|nr:Cof-type HAD-IIB family hydrolase [Clostridia bacterium]
MAVDVDGTLVDSNGAITGETKKAVRLGVDKGLIFTICTGRPIQSAAPLCEELGLDLPFITYNGAMVVMGKSREILYEKKMSAEDALNIYKLGEKYGVTVVVWTENKLYVNRMDERAHSYSKLARTTPILPDNMTDVLKNGATKILWYDTEEKIRQYEDEVGQYLGENVNYHPSKPIFLEFVDKNASKAIAMERLGQYFGIDRREMIAVGDGINDLSMIEYAGLGIAMANAREEVKQKAGYVTLSNDEDGVAHAIYKFVLNMD